MSGEGMGTEYGDGKRCVDTPRLNAEEIVFGIVAF